MAALLTALGEVDVAVVAVDPVRTKRERALVLGASRAFTPEEAVESGLAADVVIEAAGQRPRLRDGGRPHRTRGADGDRGAARHRRPVRRSRRSRWSPKAARSSGSYLGSAVPSRDIPLFVDRWRAGRLPAQELISSRITLDGVNVAMDELAAGNAVRQLVVLDEGSR